MSGTVDSLYPADSLKSVSCCDTMLSLFCKVCDHKYECDGNTSYLHSYHNPVWHACPHKDAIVHFICGNSLAGVEQPPIRSRCCECGNPTNRSILGVFICCVCYPYGYKDSVFYCENCGLQRVFENGVCGVCKCSKGEIENV